MQSQGLSALCQNGNELPPGQYQYLGRTGDSIPKRFSVTPDGAIHWEEADSAHTAGSSQKTSVEAAEQYDYPLVKWKGKRLQGSAKAIGWLTTTFDRGYLKYQLTLEVEGGLIKSGEGVIKAAIKSGLTVQLLDTNGFRLVDFVIPGYLIHETSKESVAEARGEIPIPEPLYQQARNITIR